MSGAWGEGEVRVLVRDIHSEMEPAPRSPCLWH